MTDLLSITTTWLILYHISIFDKTKEENSLKIGQNPGPKGVLI
jgi:hypothetical protein